MKQIEEPMKLYKVGEYEPLYKERQNYLNPNNIALRNYYDEYCLDDKKIYIVKYTHYEKILRRVMYLLCQKILQGHELKTPLGIFMIWKCRNTTVDRMDYRATRRLREESGDQEAVVKRTNEWWYRIDWTKSLIVKNLNAFAFRVNKLVAHDIPKHEIHYLNVPVKE